MKEFTKIERSFWETDEARDMTPEEKYFWMYLQTNANVNALGCYPFRMRKAMDETGYNKDTIEKLLDRMEGLELIRFSRKTMEVFLLNFPAISWSRKTVTKRAMMGDLKEIKSDMLKELLNRMLAREGFFAEEPEGTAEDSEEPEGTTGNSRGREGEREREGEEKKNVKKESSAKRSFTPPTPEEVLEYCREKGLEYLEPQEFIDFYESKGWLVGKTKMKDWKAAARRWNRGNEQDGKAKAKWVLEEPKGVRQSSPKNDELNRRLALMGG